MKLCKGCHEEVDTSRPHYLGCSGDKLYYYYHPGCFPEDAPKRTEMPQEAPKPSGTGIRPTKFLERLTARLAKGEQEYGQASFARTVPELCDEIQQELEDVAGWGYVLWTKIQDIKEKNQGVLVFRPLANDNGSCSKDCPVYDKLNGDPCPLLLSEEIIINGIRKNGPGKNCPAKREES